MKRLKTAQELTSLAQERLMNVQEVIEDGGQPVLGLAQWHERDEQGCNWNITMVANGVGYEDSVRTIVDELRLSYDLQPANH
jgi:hypothetical protein